MNLNCFQCLKKLDKRMKKKILEAIDNAVYNVLSTDITDQDIEWDDAKINNKVNFKKEIRSYNKHLEGLMHDKKYAEAYTYVKEFPYLKYTVKSRKELGFIVRRFIDIDPCCNLNWLDVHKVKNMSRIFAECFTFSGNVSEWDVSNVTDMSQMFIGCREFNGMLENWNVENVEDMTQMFLGCKKYNQPLSSWGKKLKNLKKANDMFAHCLKFNQDLIAWNISGVSDLSCMFFECVSFNGDLSGWIITPGTFTDQMFWKCKNFTGKGLDTWNMVYPDDHRSLSRIEEMFSYCSKLNVNLHSWYVPSGIPLETEMFTGCSSMPAEYYPYRY